MYNQPNLSSCASWNDNPTTITNISTIELPLVGILVNISNTICDISPNSNTTPVSNEETITSVINISGYLIISRHLFFKTENGVYVDNSDFKQTFDERILDPAVCFAAKKFVSRCIAIFIDINNTFYCSLDQEHQVVKLLHHSSSCTEKIVAGNGTNGSTSRLLSHPSGIFVDINLDLYVADSGNNRIQLFHLGNENGTTVAGNKDLEPNELNFPTAVVVDTRGYLFIADCGNHRIIRSHQNGFQCIVGCFKNNDSALNQLYHPRALWFDSSGNMFILDKNNTRIQRFLLSTDPCGMRHSCSYEFFVVCQSKDSICV